MGAKLVRNDAFHTVEMDGNTLLYRPTSNRAIHMDEIASVIWKMCDGTRSAEDLADELSALYPDNTEAVKADVWTTIDILLKREAIAQVAG